MGCGVSKLDGVPEPRPRMQSHGRDKVQLTGKLGASKPIQVASVPDQATCMSVSPSVVINNPDSPPSVCNIRTQGLPSSDEDESDLDSSYEFPSNLSIEELEGNTSRTTALAALSGEKTRTDEEGAEKRVEANLSAEGVLSIDHSREYSTCPLGMLSGEVVFQDRMGTSPVITEQRLAGGLLQARVGRVAVISNSEPIHLEDRLQRAEIIDLDESCSCVLRPSEEPDVGEVLPLENTHEKQGDQSDQVEGPPHPQLAGPANLAAPAAPDNDGQENSDQESASPLTEQPKQQELQLHDAIYTNKILSGPEPRKTKLPPLTIVPPIPHTFGKPALPVAVKQDQLEVKQAAVSEAEAQLEDLSARTPDLAALDSANADNHNTSASSPATEQCKTPTPATNSPADSEWRNLQRNTLDLDIEYIELLDSKELDISPDRPPLVPTLDCHGIHMDKKDLISPSLRLT